MDVHPIKNVSIGIDPYPYRFPTLPQRSTLSHHQNLPGQTRQASDTSKSSSRRRAPVEVWLIRWDRNGVNDGWWWFSGWWGLPKPLWKIWKSSVEVGMDGNSQLIWKVIKFHGSSHHQAVVFWWYTGHFVRLDLCPFQLHLAWSQRISSARNPGMGNLSSNHTGPGSSQIAGRYCGSARWSTQHQRIRPLGNG